MGRETTSVKTTYLLPNCDGDFYVVLELKI